uniref:Uncharacterized protein n=1 Tax=Ananas comosus var. bracteatus TaxID=296719 RepID=A0A6V7NYD6_ANACO|nr:unnamed protein product [Ananas comosus var. bracteatus]
MFDGEVTDPWVMETWLTSMEALFENIYTLEKDKVHLAAHWTGSRKLVRGKNPLRTIVALGTGPLGANRSRKCPARALLSGPVPSGRTVHRVRSLPTSWHSGDSHRDSYSPCGIGRRSGLPWARLIPRVGMMTTTGPLGTAPVRQPTGGSQGHRQPSGGSLQI